MNEDNELHPLQKAENSTFWLPFKGGDNVQLSPNFSLNFTESFHIPIFLFGEDQQEYRETGKVPITPHTLLMGILIGYGEKVIGIPNPEKEKEFLARTIRQMAMKVFAMENVGDFLLAASNWLRESLP